MQQRHGRVVVGRKRFLTGRLLGAHELREETARGRAAQVVEKTWNNPLSIKLSKTSGSSLRARVSMTKKVDDKPRSTAFRFARWIGSSGKSIPLTAQPRPAKKRAFSLQLRGPQSAARWLPKPVLARIPVQRPEPFLGGRAA
jgi:hypothetical protein